MALSAYKSLWPTLRPRTLFYTPSKDFVGSDTVKVEVEAGDARTTDYSIMIMVQEEADGK